jgi:hypothetical protein
LLNVETAILMKRSSPSDSLRGELRLEQYLIARELTYDGSAAALEAQLQVNASAAMLAYLRSLLSEHQPPKQAA